MADDELGNENGDMAIFVLAFFGKDVLEERHQNGAVGRGQALEFGLGQAGVTEGFEDFLFPLSGELVFAVVGIG